MTLKEGKNREIRNICKYYKWNINQLIRLSYDRFTLQYTSHLTGTGTGTGTEINNLPPLKSGGFCEKKQRVVYTLNSGEIIEVDKNIVKEILIQVDIYLNSVRNSSNSSFSNIQINTTSNNNSNIYQQSSSSKEVKPGSLLTRPDNTP